tara:strand:+ start:508 stop:903 length:396 start_codon:yes stop_codon:yes gene_type:complete
MATSDEEVMQKISEEMAQHYNKNYAKFGPMGKTASDSNAVTEDVARAAKAGVLGSGMGSIAGMGQAAAQAAAAQEAAMAMGAGNRQMSEAARRQAVMAELNKARPMGMKSGGKVSKSGRSYRGYGKARIPS